MQVSDQIFEFLSELSENNYREWFHEHKKEYEEAWDHYLELVTYLLAEVSGFDKQVSGTGAKDCAFRVYRDIRFSPDKTPYKTHFGAYLANGGRKSPLAGYYLHLSPGASMLAGGLYVPDPDSLRKVRDAIYHETPEYLSIIEETAFKKLFGLVDGEKLKKAPKGYPPDFEHIDLLKYKSFNVFIKLGDKEITDPGFVGRATEVFRMMYPFNAFLNRAMLEA